MQLSSHSPTGRAVVYARVSTERQADGLSIPTQIERCCERARSDGYPVERIVVVEDPGISGRTLDRPGIERILAEIDEVSAIYVWSISRLSRSALDLLRLVSEVIIPREIHLVSLTEGFDTHTPHGRFSLGIIGLVAQLEREQTVQNTRRGLQRRAEAGLFHGHAPFGYRYGDSGIEPDAETAPVLKATFKRYADGASLNELTQHLNATCPTQQGGGVWWSSTLADILRNPVYIGRRRWRGQVLPAAHEPIVSARLWNRVQERLAHNAMHQPERRRSSWAGLYRCGVCGGPMVVRSRPPKRPGAPRYRTYRCGHNTQLPRESRHSSTAVSIQSSNHHLWEAFLGIVTAGDLRAWVNAEQQARGDEREAARVRAMREELAGIEHGIAYNVDAARAGGLDVELLARQNAPLLERRAELLASLEQHERSRLSRAEAKLFLRWTEDDAREALQLLRSEERRTILQDVVDHVDCHPKRLTVHWRVPGAPAQEIILPARFVPKRP